jgi:glycogen(starch) synthase
MTADTMGGVWTYALELIKSLAVYNVSVTLATMGAPVTPQQAKNAANIDNLNLREGAEFKLEWMENPWQDVRNAGEWLLDLEASVQPDLIHLNGYSHGSLPWQHPVLVIGHSCVLSWWQAVKQEDAPAHWNCFTPTG